VNDGARNARECEEVAQLVRGTAHELRNNMQAIAINVEVLRARVRAAAPELWDEVERFASAADLNVRELNGRLDLLLAASRRGADDERASVDLAAVVGDLSRALRFDRTSPRIVLEAESDERGVRAHRGALVVLLHRVLMAAREASSGEESRVNIGLESEEATLEAPVGGLGLEAWESDAAAAGAVSSIEGTAPARRLVLRFPRA
jgi:signal transduction histidine kinase